MTSQYIIETQTESGRWEVEPHSLSATESEAEAAIASLVDTCGYDAARCRVRAVDGDRVPAIARVR